MNYGLPTSVLINGEECRIRNRGDYRVILDVISALSDLDLDEYERCCAALFIFYEEEDHNKIKDPQLALEKIACFINCGEKEMDTGKSSLKLMDWEQDFNLVVAPINRIIGKEIRAIEYLHWWSFISAYYEIGECAFANIVSIRKKLKTGKKLEKWEKDFYRDNKSTIDLKQRISTEEQNMLDLILNS